MNCNIGTPRQRAEALMHTLVKLLRFLCDHTASSDVDLTADNPQNCQQSKTFTCFSSVISLFTQLLSCKLEVNNQPNTHTHTNHWGDLLLMFLVFCLFWKMNKQIINNTYFPAEGVGLWPETLWSGWPQSCRILSWMSLGLDHWECLGNWPYSEWATLTDALNNKETERMN